MTTVEVEQAVAALANELRARGAEGVEVALVLGSGQGAFADRLDDARQVPFDQLEGMPQSRVPGHAGRFVIGTLGGRRTLVQQGRVHLYEGHPAERVVRSVRALADLGCKTLILTNAAGGVRSDLEAGTLMRLVDHLDLQGRGPLLAHERGGGSPYSEEVGQALERAGEAAGVQLERGVYAGLLGPSYETPAEIRLLERLGVDAVGMSTVAEAQAAAAAGLAVGAISLISNPAARIGAEPLDHDEVVRVGRESAGRLGDLLEAAVPLLAGL